MCLGTHGIAADLLTLEAASGTPAMYRYVTVVHRIVPGRRCAVRRRRFACPGTERVRMCVRDAHSASPVGARPAVFDQRQRNLRGPSFSRSGPPAGRLRPPAAPARGAARFSLHKTIWKKWQGRRLRVRHLGVMVPPRRPAAPAAIRALQCEARVDEAEDVTTNVKDWIQGICRTVRGGQAA